MTLVRFAIFFSIISIIVCGLTFLILKKRLKLEKKATRILAVVLFLSGVLMVVAPTLFRVYQVSIENPANYALQFTQYYMMGWIGITMIVAATAEILQYVFKKFDPSKRIFLTEGVTKGILAGTTLASFGGFLQMKWGPKVERVSIKLPTLPPAFDGFTIVQLSDIHIGPMLHRDFAQKIVAEAMALKADLIAITGDAVDGTVDQLQHHVEPLRGLQAEHGVHFITGNHEYYSGPESWLSHFESFGFHIYRNSNRILEKKNSAGEIEKLLLGGVYDVQGERFSELHKTDPFKAAETREPVSCKILLAHNPRSIEDATKAGFHLQLSGHTHAGQFYPFVWIARMAHQYFEGHYHVNENTQIYVNRGTGFWGPPNRLGKTSEITHITLKRS